MTIIKIEQQKQIQTNYFIYINRCRQNLQIIFRFI
jgi:hypothetical protein